MEKIRFMIAVASLIGTLAFGSAWMVRLAHADESHECNCIDGFSHQSGYVSGSHCITDCYVITRAPHASPR